jgi:hypothetical protein
VASDPARPEQVDPSEAVDPGAHDHVSAVDHDGAVDPGALIAGVVRSVLTMVSRARTPLAAELVVCGLLGMTEQGADADPSRRSDLRTDVLAQVIGAAEQDGSAAALALLRTCSVIGPEASRSAAAAAAQRLAASGVRDRTWADEVGSPRAIRAWWFGDRDGGAESVGVLFEYGPREHAVTVLIDHGSGGGIQDCSVSEGRQAHDLRHDTADLVAGRPGHAFADLDLVEAAQLLQSALEVPPCPRGPEQIAALADHLELVRARSERLTAQVAEPRRRPQAR